MGCGRTIGSVTALHVQLPLRTAEAKVAFGLGQLSEDDMKLGRCIVFLNSRKERKLKIISDLRYNLCVVKRRFIRLPKPRAMERDILCNL